MIRDAEVHEFLLRHLQAIQDNDVQTYRATSAEDLTVYEWWVTPHRIDGLPFQLMPSVARTSARRGRRKNKVSPRSSTFQTCTSSVMAILPLPVTPFLSVHPCQMVNRWWHTTRVG